MNYSKLYLKSLLAFVLLLFSQFVFAAGGDILKTTEEFQFKQAAGFEAEEPYSQVWHYKNSTYLVWVDGKYRAWVTQVTDGKAVTVPVDPQPDYLVQADGHHRFALGVDKLGYIHITGDMHHYSDFTTDVITPYVKRYQNQKILYWRSTKPDDISGGFTFRGNTFDTAIPGGGWILGRFFADNNGELYYSSHVHAYESSNSLGQQAVGLYKLDANKQAWAAIGGLAPKSDPYLSHHYPVFYWEDSGSSGGWFQNYQASFKFDKSNRLYFAVTSNTNPKLAGANRLLFAMSDDGGLTWKKANGTTLGSLPLRGIDGLASTADVVADTGTSNFFGAKPGIVVDNNGKIGISIDSSWRVWDGKTWATSSPQNFPNVLSTNMGYRLPNNELILNAFNYNKLTRTDVFDNKPFGYDFIGYNQLTCLDDYGLRATGSIYGLAQRIDGSTEAILKTTITPAPLPAGWANQDIDSQPAPYKGNTGYLDGKFVMTSFGEGMNDKNDSFHFAYKKMRGDGSMIARVNPLELANGRGGVMMRETLDSNAKQASVLINANKSIVFSSRSTIGDYSSNTEIPNIKAPYWVRLDRVGNVFTGFISPDGKAWTKTQTVTIAMNQDIYVGLGLASYRFRFYMDAATFDNISAPGDICVPAAPSISLNPTTQTGSAGGSVSYAVSVINNDSSACAANQINLTAALPASISGAFDKTSLSLAPGATGAATLKLSSVATTAPSSYKFTAKATSGSLSASTDGTYVVTSSCTLTPPTITLAPLTKTTYGFTPAYYVVTILDNDTADCGARLFSFSTDTSNYYLKGWMEPYNIFLDPGKSTTSLVTLTPQPGLALGSYVIKTSTQRGGLGQATLVYAASPAVVVKPSSDKPVYDRQATAYNAVLAIIVLKNGQEVPNVPITATLTWPTGTTQTFNSVSANAITTFNQAIQKDSPVGIYDFSVTATFEGKQVTNDVMFSVR
jgi:regulation of enolase protein 1 (concanavalin A-like superfamily)